jgi:ankyrin repeat protein
MRHFTALKTVYFLVGIFSHSMACGWVDFKTSDSASRLEQKARILATHWIFPKLGLGKFDSQGGIFCIDRDLEDHLQKKEDIVFNPGDFLVTLVKLDKTLPSHEYDYIISNSRTRYRLLYFSDKARPDEHKMCPIKDVPTITEDNFKEAVFSNCVFLEFKKIFSKSRKKELLHVEWNVKEPSKGADSSAPFEILASIKKDKTGFSYQCMGLAFKSLLYGSYLTTIMAFEARAYEQSRSFGCWFQEKGLKLFGLVGLSAAGLLGIKKCWDWMVTPDNRSILLVRAVRGGIERVKLLEGRHPECFLPEWINGQDGSGKTALHVAVEQEDLEVVRFLLAKGADPEITDILNKLMAQSLMEARFPQPIVQEISRVLWEQIVQKRPAQECTATYWRRVLDLAIENRWAAVVKGLIDKFGDSLNISGGQSMSVAETEIYWLPLLASIMKEDVEIVKQFCHQSSFTNALSLHTFGGIQDDVKEQRLFNVDSDKLNFFKSCKNRLGMGVDDQAITIFPLELAVLKNNGEMVKLLLDNPLTDASRRLDENKEGEKAIHKGWTVLHFAAALGGDSIVKLLVESRPNLISLETQDSDRYTAEALATKYGRLEIAEFLRQPARG